MSEVFRPGDKVIAYYESKTRRWENGWYNGVIVRLDEHGDYWVRWQIDRNEMDMPLVSPVSEDQIKHGVGRRGPYSAGF